MWSLGDGKSILVISRFVSPDKCTFFFAQRTDISSSSKQIRLINITEAVTPVISATGTVDGDDDGRKGEGRLEDKERDLVVLMLNGLLNGGEVIKDDKKTDSVTLDGSDNEGASEMENEESDDETSTI